MYIHISPPPPSPPPFFLIQNVNTFFSVVRREEMLVGDRSVYIFILPKAPDRQDRVNHITIYLKTPEKKRIGSSKVM